jgi:hypothetical protein
MTHGGNLKYKSYIYANIGHMQETGTTFFLKEKYKKHQELGTLS